MDIWWNMMKHGTLGVFPFLRVACYPADRETVTIFFWLALPASLSTIPCRSYALSLTTAQPSAPTKTAYDLPTCLVHMLSLVSSWRFPAILSSQQKQLICWWAMVQESNVLFLLLRLACNMSFFVIAADPEFQKFFNKPLYLYVSQVVLPKWFQKKSSRRTDRIRGSSFLTFNANEEYYTSKIQKCHLPIIYVPTSYHALKPFRWWPQKLLMVCIFRTSQESLLFSWQGFLLHVSGLLRICKIIFDCMFPTLSAATTATRKELFKSCKVFGFSLSTSWFCEMIDDPKTQLGWNIYCTRFCKALLFNNFIHLLFFWIMMIW